MTPYRPSKIFVEKDAADLPHAQKILKNLAHVPVEEIETASSLKSFLQKKCDPVGEGKKYLLLRRDKGRSFKPFPESEPYLSCDYYTLHVAEGCDLECSYCILQAYLTNPLLTVYVNVEEILQNLQNVLDQNPDSFFRIGTGQLADSLSMDSITGFTETLVPFFARQKNAVLELKTKSVSIGRLLALKPEGRTIVSWSMNSKKIQKEEEHKCASLEERLEAAQKVIRAGYRTGFHFDPIIDDAGWEEEYGEVVEKIFDKIPAEKIAWVSLGCLRFMPELKTIMQNRFPKSKLALAEWISGMDGKMRYLKSRRITIYREMVKNIRRRSNEVTIYLTMESPEVWQRVFGGEHTKGSVCEMLNAAGSVIARSTEGATKQSQRSREIASLPSVARNDG